MKKYCVLVLLLTVTSCFPMAQCVRTIAAKLRAAKPIIKKVAYWGTIGIPAWASSSLTLKEYNRQHSLPSASPSIQNFVYKELGTSIPVKMDYKLHEGGGETNGQTICLGHQHDGTSKLDTLLRELDQIQELRNASPHDESLKKQEQQIQKQLNWYKAMLHHEKGHIDQHHVPQSLALMLAHPFLVHGTLQGAIKLGLKTMLGKTAVGIAAYAAANAAHIKLVRTHEYDADEAIPNQPALLQAALEHFKNHEQESSEDFLLKNPGTSYEELQRMPFSLFYAMYHHPHPVPLQRVERLEQRLAALQQQPDKKAEAN